MDSIKLQETDDGSYIIWLVTINDKYNFAFSNKEDAIHFHDLIGYKDDKRITRIYIYKDIKNAESDYFDSITNEHGLFNRWHIVGYDW